MAYEILNPEDFLTDLIFRQDQFMENIAAFDWSRYEFKSVLVKGCNTAIIPPWALMAITARLIPQAKSIRFGNEHDNVVVFRRSGRTKGLDL